MVVKFEARALSRTLSLSVLQRSIRHEGELDRSENKKGQDGHENNRSHHSVFLQQRHDGEALYDG